MKYPRISPKRLSGIEEFSNTGRDVVVNVSQYWAWSHSNLSANIERGILAEFLVASALGVDGDPNLRDPWGDSDIIVGDMRVEVKASAYIQDWNQKDFSRIVFSGLRGRWLREGVDNQGNSIPSELNTEPGGKNYKSHVYVLTVQKHQDHGTFDLLDLNQWEFYVLSRQEIIDVTKRGNSLSLKALSKGNYHSTPYSDISGEIHRKYHHK